MPKIQLLYSRRLGDGKTFKVYPKGQHTVSDAVLKHYYTVAEMKEGTVSVVFEQPEPKKDEKSSK
jgi:hypothetical protein